MIKNRLSRFCQHIFLPGSANFLYLLLLFSFPPSLVPFPVPSPSWCSSTWHPLSCLTYLIAFLFFFFVGNGVRYFKLPLVERSICSDQYFPTLWLSGFLGTRFNIWNHHLMKIASFHCFTKLGLNRNIKKMGMIRPILTKQCSMRSFM